jgi:hypothetical protein
MAPSFCTDRARQPQARARSATEYATSTPDRLAACHIRDSPFSCGAMAPLTRPSRSRAERGGGDPAPPWSTGAQRAVRKLHALLDGPDGGGRLPGGSGPAVARLFHRLLALTFVAAWISLGVQVQALVGSRGLLPAAPYLQALRGAGKSWWDAPTLFLWLDASDAVLSFGIALGVGLSLAALGGIATRPCLGMSTVLYLSYITVGRTFFSFQWDNLLLECGMLAVFLPRQRPARWAHVLFRILLFKLYLESGIAKWQSPLGDWHDGSAMTFYYETAPLPSPGAWFLHSLPQSWHHFESWLTLGLELVLPFGVFGPRRVRLVTAASLTGFQIVNAATANYGFFCYLSAALHVFLLDDRDILRARSWLGRRLTALRTVMARLRLLRIRAAALFSPKTPPSGASPGERPGKRLERFRVAGAMTAFGIYVGASLLGPFSRSLGPRDMDNPLDWLAVLISPLRVVNTYHLFAQITRERIEPEVQVTIDGSTFIAMPLHHKPGDPSRAPGWVAPHQPRLDFQLWFYGLSFRRGMPPYVAALLERICRDPDAVQSLFPQPLPREPEAVRIAFFRYHFTSPAQRESTGAWWSREEIGATRPLACR